MVLGEKEQALGVGEAHVSALGRRQAQATPARPADDDAGGARGGVARAGVERAAHTAPAE